MPTLTAKQRLQKLVAAFGAREGLRRLLALDGVATPGAADGSAKPVPSQPLVLPAWITDERADAIVSHFLHGDLLLPWQVAPFWQDQWVAEGWPMVGAATVPSWQGAGAGAPSAGFAAWQASPVSAASALKEAAQAVPPEPPAALPDVPLQLWMAQGKQHDDAVWQASPFSAASALKEAAQPPPPAQPSAIPPVPPQLWATIVERYGDAVWLWTKYRKYFHVVAGKPPLLAGVLLEHEVAQGTLQLTLTQADGAAQQPKTAVVEVDCFAYTLAVAIGVLESTDFATVHNIMPKGYPSQWQAPEPATTVWMSPLHGDARFWHEFDKPPVGDRGRFVRQGLTRQEAVRVWARRVAVCLWGDANGHWGRWPWRLATTSLAMRRRLLGWDAGTMGPMPAEFSKLAASYGVVNTSQTIHDGMATLAASSVFGQLIGPLPTANIRGQSYQGYGIWDCNPAVAWMAAWHDWEGRAVTAGVPRSAEHCDSATRWITLKFQSMGMWHGPGWLRRVPSKKDVVGASDLPSAGVRQWFRARTADGALFRVCSLAEVLDLNMGGCHTNGAVAISLLRSQCVPATLSHDEFFDFGFASEVDAVDGTDGEGRYVPVASLNSDGSNFVTGHASIVLGFQGNEMFLEHSDRLLADRLGLFQDPNQVWIPFAEHMLVLAATNMKQGFGLDARRCCASHERARTIHCLHRAAMSWGFRRAEASSFDAARSSSPSPMAMRRLCWFEGLERTLMSSDVRSLKGGPLLVQAAPVLVAAEAWSASPQKKVDSVYIAKLRRLVAMLLGIDSALVWPYSRKAAPTGLGPDGPGIYLAAAPYPSNFELTGSTGQLCLNYGNGGVEITADWANVEAGAYLLSAIQFGLSQPTMGSAE